MRTDDPAPQPGRYPVAYSDWVLGMIGWDGVLPVCVVLAPLIVKHAAPNHPGAIEVIAIVLPISALLIRFVVGSRAIAANHCGVGFRRVQYVALCVAILFLLFVDAMLVLSHNMPKRALIKEDLIVWAALALFYLTIMAVAMYPGRARQSGP